MASQQHIAVLEEGSEAWNGWRQENPDIVPDLSRDNLIDRVRFLKLDIEEMDLQRVNLSEANLSGAPLEHKNLKQVRFANGKLCNTQLRGANLRGANFNGAELCRADIRDADLRDANFGKANLRDADLRGASLQNMNLSKAILRNTNLCNANFSEVEVNEAVFARSILCRANFAKKKLDGEDFRGADLREATFRFAFLRNAKLSEADLTNADLRRAFLHRANLNAADLSEANLRNAVLEKASMVETCLKGADLTGSNVYGASVWDISVEETIQNDLIATPKPKPPSRAPKSPTLRVDDLEIAQFAYLMLENDKIRNVIDTVGKKAVLILGRFTEERKRVLEALRDEIRALDYLPLVFSFEPSKKRNLTETISILAHMSRFVIADVTDPRSVPHELATIVPRLPSVPVQTIIQSPQHEYGMLDDLRDYPWMLPIQRYNDSTSLIQSVEEVIAPAVEKSEEVEAKRREKIN